MNGIHVELIGIGDWNTVPLGKLGISVTGAAGSRQVKGINERIRISRS
jgi:hypothetical protein